MSMELVTVTRQKLSPDPEFDSVAALSWVLTNDVPEGGRTPPNVEGLFITGGERIERWSRSFGKRQGIKAKVIYFKTEAELIQCFARTVVKADPGETH